MLRRRAGQAVAVLIAVILGAVAISQLTREPPKQAGFEFFPEAHRGEPFAKELFAEIADELVEEDEELFFVNGDVDRTYVHVDDGVRRSRAGPSDAPVIWFVGGSTMFGYGQRDDHTIPSEVVRLAAKDGTPVQAVNLGVSAYLAWQETGLLERRLRGHDAPDVIVIYHGVNDLSTMCRQLADGDPPGGHVDPRTSGPYPEKPAVDCYADPEGTGKTLAGIIDKEVAAARATADGVPIVEYWQPYASTRTPNRFDDALFEHVESRREYADFQAAVYRSALDQRRLPVVDLTDALDGAPGPIYYDFAHTNEEGARLVAQAMWERSLRAQVEDAGKRS